MLFNFKNIHTIYEEADIEKQNAEKVSDETGANLDNTLGDSDLLSIYNDICPISGDVFAAMKNAASDPKNLKITMTKDGDGEDAKMFIEAVEFMSFIEATGLTVGEAAEEILTTYAEEVPEMDNAEVHVVFPSEALDKNVLGSESLGKDVRNEWPMKLISGCRRYGLKINSGIEK